MVDFAAGNLPPRARHRGLLYLHLDGAVTGRRPVAAVEGDVVDDGDSHETNFNSVRLVYPVAQRSLAILEGLL
ncbi:hypothetical protein HYQ46_002933 [Verticillium longisporum]|nr:hypothetical protein HYQ46_002933 [Verticillium longisporum]